jgi:hypothetical protein
MRRNTKTDEKGITEGKKSAKGRGCLLHEKNKETIIVITEEETRHHRPRVNNMRRKKDMLSFPSSSNHLIVLLVYDVASYLTSWFLLTPWVFRLFLLLLTLDPFGLRWNTVDSLSPSCKCILFKETYGKEYGVFTSPNWPTPYEKNIDCLLFTFEGPADHLIEVTFDEFDVQRTNE